MTVTVPMTVMKLSRRDGAGNLRNLDREPREAMWGERRLGLMPDGIMPGPCIEKWPTLAYRILLFRSAWAPDSRRPDTPIMRSDYGKGKAAGGRTDPVFWNLRLSRGKRSCWTGPGRREHHAFFGKFGMVSGMDIVNHRDTVPFTTADGSTIRELLAHRNSAICQQSLAEARLKPGCATVPHHHAVTEEIYYILTGTAAMTLGSETRDVGPGDAIAIPPGIRHTIRNTGPVELVFLCTCAPGYEHTDTFLETPTHS